MSHALREAFSTPAVVHEDLFSWATKQATAAKRAQEALALAVQAEADARLTVEGLAQYALAEAAKLDLANAKKAALEEDPAVDDAKKAAKAARKALRQTIQAQALKIRRSETKLAESAERMASRELVERLAK